MINVSISVFQRKVSIFFILNLLAFGIPTAQVLAQTSTVIDSVSSAPADADLEYTFSVSTKPCQLPFPGSETTYDFTSFQYVVGGTLDTLTGKLIGGTSYPLAGVERTTLTQGPHCPLTGELTPLTFALPFTYDSGDYCTITWEYGPSVPGGTVSDVVSLSCTPMTISLVNPAYQVISVFYAPPGDLSSVAYPTGTTNGSASSIGSSVMDGKSMSFSLSDTFSIPFINLSLGITSTSSSGTSSTTSSNTQFQETFTDATGDGLQSSKTNPDGINHNLDSVLIWLNPQISIYSVGSTPETYTVYLEPVGDDQTPQPDVIGVPVIDMEAQPGSITAANPAGLSTVPVNWLKPQSVTLDTGGVIEYPGLAAICKNKSYYPNNCGGDPNGQCGCTPADFTNILAQDPLLSYSNTASPLGANVSAPSICAQNPVPAGSNCRYVPVPSATGSTSVLSVLLQGSGCPDCDPVPKTYSQIDANQQNQTLGGQNTQTSGASWSVSSGGLTVTTANTITYTQSESTSFISGSSSSEQVTLNTSNYDCDESVNIYEDTVYHTFVFQEPGGDTGCTVWPPPINTAP